MILVKALRKVQPPPSAETPAFIQSPLKVIEAVYENKEATQIVHANYSGKENGRQPKRRRASKKFLSFDTRAPASPMKHEPP